MGVLRTAGVPLKAQSVHLPGAKLQSWTPPCLNNRERSPAPPYLRLVEQSARQGPLQLIVGQLERGDGLHQGDILRNGASDLITPACHQMKQAQILA